MGYYVYPKTGSSISGRLRILILWLTRSAVGGGSTNRSVARGFEASGRLRIPSRNSSCL